MAIQGDKCLATIMGNAGLERRGIETPFYEYASAAKLKPRDCHIRMHALKDNGSELAVSSFLEWQTRMYQSVVRKSALGADEGLPSVHSESTQAGSDDDEDGEEGDVDEADNSGEAEAVDAEG